MEEKEFTVTLGGERFDFDEADQIGKQLFDRYREIINLGINHYLTILEIDSRAVGLLKMKGIEVALDSSEVSESDKVPYACALRVLINQFRSAYEDQQVAGGNDDFIYETPDDAIDSIVDTIIESGESILYDIFSDDTYSLSLDQINKKILDLRIERYRIFYEQFYKEDYESFESFVYERLNDDSENESFHINDTIAGKYEKKTELWRELTDFGYKTFPDLEKFSGKQINVAAKKEIAWRKEYLGKKQNSSIVLNVKHICMRNVIELIYYTFDAFGIKTRRDYFKWTAYQNCLMNLIILQDGKTQEADKITIEALKEFPFEKNLYKYVLREFGDEDGSVTKIADFLDFDIADFKEELLTTYISTMKDVPSWDEDGLKDQLEKVHNYKKFLAYDVPTDIEEKIEAQLKKIDLMMRTVRDKVYETREEADNVKSDYAYLNNIMRHNIDFTIYDYFNSIDITNITNYLLAQPYKSDAFKNDQAYVLNELQPVLDRYKQVQVWREQIYTSKEPWKMIESVVLNCGIMPALKDKFKYWNFDGLKKYRPILYQYEGPVLYYQLSLFGWSNYFVLTNKRAIHIIKKTQQAIFLNEKISVDYQNGALMFIEDKKTIVMNIPFKYNDDLKDPLVDVLNLIVAALCKLQ